MPREIQNKDEFHSQLDKLGELYEEGKDCLAHIYNPDPHHARLYEILRDMRDMAAVQLQEKHWVAPN